MTTSIFGAEFDRCYRDAVDKQIIDQMIAEGVTQQKLDMSAWTRATGLLPPCPEWWTARHLDAIADARNDINKWWRFNPTMDTTAQFHWWWQHSPWAAEPVPYLACLAMFQECDTVSGRFG